MNTQEMMEVRDKICNQYKTVCVQCPLSIAKIGMGCLTCIRSEPEEIEKILIKWEEEHQAKPRMLSSEEIIRKLEAKAEEFEARFYNKSWYYALSCYKDALTITMFLELGEQKTEEIMSLFPADKVQKVRYEAAVKRQYDPMYHPEVLTKK